jgi:hypothetical protein
MKTTLLLFALMISMFAVPNSFAASGSDATLEVYDSSAEDEALAKAYAEEEAKYKAEQEEMEKQYQEQLAQEAADKAEQIEMEQKYQEQLEKDKKFQEEQAKMEQLYQEQNQAEMEKLYQEQQTQESTQKESQVEMEKLYQEQEGNEQYEPSQAYDQDTTSTMPKDGQYIDMDKDEASYYKEQAKGDSMQAAAEQLMQDCMSKGGDMQSCMQSVRGLFENGNTGESASTQNMSSGDSDIAEQMMNDCMDKGGDLKSCMESVSNSFEGGSMDGGGSMQQMNGMPSDEMEQLMNKCISEGGDMQSCINVVNKAFEEGEELGIGVRGPLSTDNKCDKEDETQQIEGELYVCEGGVLLSPLGGDGVFSVEDDLGIGVRGSLTKEISDEDKEYISSLGEGAIDSWNDNNREYRSIKSIGCDNLEIRLINDERYVCSNNEWLGPLGGDGVFSNGSDIDDKSGVIIGDNHFKNQRTKEIEKINASVASELARFQQSISKMSKEEVAEMQDALKDNENQASPAQIAEETRSQIWSDYALSLETIGANLRASINAIIFGVRNVGGDDIRPQNVGRHVLHLREIQYYDNEFEVAVIRLNTIYNRAVAREAGIYEAKIVRADMERRIALQTARTAVQRRNARAAFRAAEVAAGSELDENIEGLLNINRREMSAAENRRSEYLAPWDIIHARNLAEGGGPRIESDRLAIEAEIGVYNLDLVTITRRRDEALAALL